MASAFGMTILLNDPPMLDNAEDQQLLKGKFSHGEFTDIEELASRSDIITFHTPLTISGKYKTYHLANEDFFSLIKKNTVVINSSRGEVVDNQVLKEVLKKNAVSGAVLDVWENEPEIDEELVKFVNFATPHIAGYSADGKANGTAMSIQAVSRFFGLGLDSWSPDNIPAPENSEIDVSKCDGSDSDILRYVFNCSYDINSDSSRLIADTAGFEKLRGNYPLRREPHAFNVSMPSSFTGKKIAHILHSLGFKTEFFS